MTIDSCILSYTGLNFMISFSNANTWCTDEPSKEKSPIN